MFLSSEKNSQSKRPPRKAQFNERTFNKGNFFVSIENVQKSVMKNSESFP